MNPYLAKLIKVVSTAAMTGALGLEIWNLVLYFQSQSLPANLIAWFRLGSVALIAHGVEGLIAAVQARSKNINPWSYGIYTFFVGFVGLQELGDR